MTEPHSVSGVLVDASISAESATFTIRGTEGDYEMSAAVVAMTSLAGRPLGEVMASSLGAPASAAIHSDGRVELDVGGAGAVVVIAPHHDFESWKISGPDGFFAVGVRGGGAAIWTGEPGMRLDDPSLDRLLDPSMVELLRSLVRNGRSG